MGEYPLEQSVWGRAWADTKCSYHNLLFFWGVEVLLMLGGGFVGAVLIPANTGNLGSALYPGIGSIIGAIVGFGIIFLVFLFLAPYRQRNEARAELQTRPTSIPLPNRADLIKAMSALQEAAIDLVKKQEQLDCWASEHPYVGHEEAGTARDQANDVYQETLGRIGSEKLVAGKAFEQPISNLITYISTQVELKLGQFDVADSNITIPSLLEFVGRIAGKVKETVAEIDKISQ